MKHKKPQHRRRLKYKLQPNRLTHWVTYWVTYRASNWYPQRRKAFTLVELVISMAIAGLLMLGLSTFFSSTFNNLFQAQSEGIRSQRQFAVNEIVSEKFRNAESILERGGNYVITLNKPGKRQLPFSFIGEIEVNGEKRLAFKDFLIFNGVKANQFSSASGGVDNEGRIYVDGSKSINKLNNPAGFTGPHNNFYYIAIPNLNEVKKCASPSSNSDECPTSMNFTLNGESYQLNNPIDVVHHNNSIYISDAGNGKIIKSGLTGVIQATVAKDLNFPSGMTVLDDYLYVSETLNHTVHRIDLSDPPNFTISKVTGQGENSDCNGNVQTCKLNLPTGLFAEDNVDVKNLYIADSGNNRILKVSDPGEPNTIHIEFDADDQFTLDRIEITNDEWNDGDYYTGNPEPTERSNLIGDSNDFIPKTFRNTDQMTIFSAGDYCNSGDSNSIYTNENPLNVGLEIDDKLIINGATYTISQTPDGNAIDCYEGDVLDVFKFPIQVNPVPNPASVPDSETVHLSNPDRIIMEFNNLDFSQPPKSFQTFKIEIFDKFAGRVQTEYHVETFGNGELGTEEDLVEVYLDQSDLANLIFPTGISSVSTPTRLHFANSLDVNLDGGTKYYDEVQDLVIGGEGLRSIVTSDLTQFDYVSDFTVDSLVFDTYNSDSIVEMVLTDGETSYRIKADVN